MRENAGMKMSSRIICVVNVSVAARSEEEVVIVRRMRVVACLMRSSSLVGVI